MAQQQNYGVKLGETGNSAGSSTDSVIAASKTGSGSKNSNDSTESNSTNSDFPH